MIRILVADDHAIVRNGLKQIVSDTTDMIVAGEASNGREALNKALEEDYDVVLLDITMPDRSGLDVLKEIKSQKPELPVLILSIHPEEQYAVRALKAGAAGYLTKESAPEELIRAMQKVSSGDKYVTSSLAEKLASFLKTGAEKPLHQALSDREYEVFCMIVSGKRVKQIADELLLSTKTISTYRSRILRKMNMSNNVELTRYAIQNQLVS
jgi:two-component system invasion response regulator UvrY